MHTVTSHVSAHIGGALLPSYHRPTFTSAQVEALRPVFAAPRLVQKVVVRPSGGAQLQLQHATWLHVHARAPSFVARQQQAVVEQRQAYQHVYAQAFQQPQCVPLRPELQQMSSQYLQQPAKHQKSLQAQEVVSHLKGQIKPCLFFSPCQLEPHAGQEEGVQTPVQPKQFLWSTEEMTRALLEQTQDLQQILEQTNRELGISAPEPPKPPCGTHCPDEPPKPPCEQCVGRSSEA